MDAAIFGTKIGLSEKGMYFLNLFLNMTLLLLQSERQYNYNVLNDIEDQIIKDGNWFKMFYIWRTGRRYGCRSPWPSARKYTQENARKKQMDGMEAVSVMEQSGFKNQVKGNKVGKETDYGRLGQ